MVGVWCRAMSDRTELWDRAQRSLMCDINYAALCWCIFRLILAFIFFWIERRRRREQCITRGSCEKALKPHKFSLSCIYKKKYTHPIWFDYPFAVTLATALTNHVRLCKILSGGAAAPIKPSSYNVRRPGDQLRLRGCLQGATTEEGRRMRWSSRCVTIKRRGKTLTLGTLLFPRLLSAGTTE